jgi:hypothetical protein
MPAVQDYRTVQHGGHTEAKIKSAETAGFEAEAIAAAEAEKRAIQDIAAAKKREMDAELIAREAHAAEAEAARLNNEQREIQIEADKKAAVERHDALTAEVAAKTKLGDYWDDVQGSTPRRILAAILIGASSSVGGNAREIYDQAAQRYRQGQEDILKAATVKEQKAGADIATIEAGRQKFLDRLAAQEAARDKKLQAHLAVIPLRNPRVQEEANQLAAHVDGVEAKRKIEQAGRYDQSKVANHSTTDVIGRPTATGTAPGVQDQIKGAQAQVDAEQAARDATFAKEHPEAMAKGAEIMRSAAKRERLEETGSKGLVGVGTMLGIVPAEKLSAAKTPEEREAVKIFSRAEFQSAAMAAKGGSIQAGERQMGREMAGVGQGTHAEVVSALDQQAQNMKRLSDAAQSRIAPPTKTDAAVRAGKGVGEKIISGLSDPSAPKVDRKTQLEAARFRKKNYDALKKSGKLEQFDADNGLK